MAINDAHIEYNENKIKWGKLRDCADGQETVHKAGKKYLPVLSGQTLADYQAYRDRALFYGATARTIDGLSGMIFRKPPQYKIPKGLEVLSEDITLSGLNLMGFAEDLVDDAITVGRAGILVDHPSVQGVSTVAQAEAENIRPFLKHYRAEHIFNWKVEGRKNAQVITQVRLWEWHEVQGEDEFEVEIEKKIRVLDLNEEGQYRQRLFKKNKASNSVKEEWIQDGEDIIPLKGNKPLDMIPFFFVGVKNNSARVEKPPLIDLANANLSHYKSTADLEHGAHFTGLPTVVVTGHSETPGEDNTTPEYRIGSDNAWLFPNPDTKAEYLEFQGQGLEALEKRIAKKEEYMAFLGARMLTPEKKAVETAETAQIHRTGETSVLASLSQSVSQTIEKALSFMAEWANIGGEIEFALNKDFMAIEMSSQQLTALLQTWQSGGIAYADFLENLKKGEIVREDRTEEDIRSEIEEENPFDGMSRDENQLQDRQGEA